MPFPSARALGGFGLGASLPPPRTACLASRRRIARAPHDHPLRAAIAFALRERALELGLTTEGRREGQRLSGYRALAAELGIRVDRARRWAKEGPPAPWTERQLQELANELWRRQQETSERRTQATRAALLRERQRPHYTIEARQAAVVRLRRELRQLERRKPCEKGTWTARMALARELGVKSVRLGRWLSAGAVPEEYMPEYDLWAQAALEREFLAAQEKSRAEEMLDIARSPGWAHTLTGQKKTRVRRTPELRNVEGVFESADSSGYEWQWRIERWMTWELIDEMCDWALTRQRPQHRLARPARYWIVTALASVLRSKNGKAPKSPGGYRQFARESHRALAGRLNIGAALSSRTVRRGGLVRAVKLFRLDATDHFCESDVIFVHGLIVRNWRHRSDRERQSYRSRIETRAKLANAERERKDARRRKKARAAARKKIQERRRSRSQRAPSGRSRESRKS